MDRDGCVNRDGCADGMPDQSNAVVSAAQRCDKARPSPCAPMTARERAVTKARRIARGQLATLAKELRQARINAGRSQTDVARAAGISTSSLSRMELDVPVGLRFEDVAAACAAVGLTASLKTYPGDHVLADDAQVRLLKEFRDRLGPGWSWRFETRIGPGDLRTWDMSGLFDTTRLSIVVDAETRVHDLQSVLRRVGGKRHDSGSPRTVLLLADTRTNRAAVAAGKDELTAEFPIGTWRALRALREGIDPGRDCLIVLRRRPRPDEDEVDDV